MSLVKELNGGHGLHHGWGFGGFGGFSLQSLEAFVAATANSALQSLGVSVTITQTGGLGVDIAYKGNTVDLTHFALDVKTGQIDAMVSLDGQSLGDVALLQLGADGTVGLTAITAKAIDAVVGSDIVSANTVFDLGKILSGLGDGDHHGRHGHGGGHTPNAIAGGETLVALPGAAMLEAHGVTISALGRGEFESFGKGSALLLPISGGQATPNGDITQHKGSGLELAYHGKTVDLMNFVFDVKDGIVQADVTIGGHDDGLQTVLDINKNGALTLTAPVAKLIDLALGKNLVSSNTVIGGGYSIPLTGGGCGHGHDGGWGGWAGGGDPWGGGHGHHA